MTRRILRITNPGIFQAGMFPHVYAVVRNTRVRYDVRRDHETGNNTNKYL
jgi:hypothetical protein